MKNLVTILILLISSTGAWAQKYTAHNTPAAQVASPYESALFRSAEGTYFNFENDDNNASAISYFNIADWLQGRVAGLQVYTIRGNRVPFMRNYPATIYVDEMRTDASILNMLSVADIALIKVIRAPQASILGGPGGAIAIYTKRGEGEEEETEEG